MNLADTTTGCHAYAGSCSSGASPEAALSFTTTTAGKYYFSLVGLTAKGVLFIRDADCNGTELACKVAPSFNGAAETVLTLGASQTVIVFVESTGTATGKFDLIVDQVP